MRIIIADRSAIVRTILEQNLNKYNDTQITASVSSCRKILNILKTETPDVIICGTDLNETIEKDAISTLCNTMKIPILILTQEDVNAPLPFFSQLTDTMEKPHLKAYSPIFFDKLLEKLSLLKEKKTVTQSEISIKKDNFKILCIGASTGGPTAVSEVLCKLGNNFPLPVLYTQHIEIGKDKALADWLNEVCPNINIKLAKDNERAMPGIVYMAPADKHLVINYVDNEEKPVLKLSDDEPERYLRPAVNKLFISAAKNYKNRTLAILLTGMGADGAFGCKEICDKGGWTIVEDKSTCAVFGMPAAAIEAGGAKEILARTEIPKRILELVNK